MFQVWQLSTRLNCVTFQVLLMYFKICWSLLRRFSTDLYRLSNNGCYKLKYNIHIYNTVRNNFFILLNYIRLECTIDNTFNLRYLVLQELVKIIEYIT